MGNIREEIDRVKQIMGLSLLKEVTQSKNLLAESIIGNMKNRSFRYPKQRPKNCRKECFATYRVVCVIFSNLTLAYRCRHPTPQLGAGRRW